MKKQLVSLMIAAAASQISVSARAQQFPSVSPSLPTKPGVRIDLRADWRTIDSYVDPPNIEQKGFSQFEVVRARLAFTGLLAPGLFSTVRLDFLRDASLTKDNTDTLINWAFMRYRISEIFAVAGGKLWLDVGGIESLYSGADLYFATLAAEMQKLNPTGFAFEYRPAADNVVTIFAINNDDVTFDDQNKLGHGITYKGTFNENAFTVQANYGTSYTGPRDAERPRRVAGLGFQYRPIPTLAFDLGYVYFFDEDTLPPNGTAINSFVTQGKYLVSHWAPWIKAEYSTVRTGIAATSFDRTRVGLALEYRPNVDKTFRYHVAWVGFTDKFKDSSLPNQSVNQSEIIVGMRMAGDIL